MRPLIFLPGMMCDERLFSPQSEALNSSAEVIHASLAEHDSMPALAASILDHAPHRFALCGLSMGGIVAMEILRQAPERVERLALLDTNPLAEAEVVRNRRFPQMEAVRNGALGDIMRDEMKPNYLAETKQKSAILDLCMDMALSLGPDVFLRQSKALMTRRDQTATLEQARLPTLVLCGRQDLLCPVARHELMADLVPGAHLEVIEDAGHLPTLEQPEQTNAALLRWLEA